MINVIYKHVTTVKEANAVLNFSCVPRDITETWAIDLPVYLVRAQSALAMGKRRVAQCRTMDVSLASVCQDTQADTVIVLVSNELFSFVYVQSTLQKVPSILVPPGVTSKFKFKECSA
jgi:hypothetical protein